MILSGMEDVKASVRVLQLFTGETGRLCQPVTRQPSHFYPHELQALISLYIVLITWFCSLLDIFYASFCPSAFSRISLWSFLPSVLRVLAFPTLFQPSLFHLFFLHFFVLSIFPLSSLTSSSPSYLSVLADEDSADCNREQVQVSLLLLITSAHAVMRSLSLALSPFL